MQVFEAIQMNSSMHHWLRLRKDRVLLPLAKVLQRLHISANQVTISGAVLGIISVPLLWIHYWWFVVAATVSFLLDGIDGTLARYSQTSSRFGARLDYHLDIMIALLQWGALIIWLQEPLWVIGLNWYVALLAINWLLGSMVQLSTNRLALVIAGIIGWPQLGLGFASLYTLIMTSVLLHRLFSVHK